MTDTKPAPPTLEQLQQLISRGPFNQWLNFTFIQADEAGIEIKATWREEWV
ncbi:MAG: phenylacetic acid degradation protein, partial [Betaproteobacteria bacterium]